MNNSEIEKLEKIWGYLGAAEAFFNKYHNDILKDEQTHKCGMAALTTAREMLEEMDIGE